jgi:hypothetical protein
MSENHRGLALNNFQELRRFLDPREGTENVLSINDNHRLVRDYGLRVDVTRKHTWNYPAAFVLNRN